MPEICRFFGIIIMLNYTTIPHPIFMCAIINSAQLSKLNHCVYWRGACRHVSWGW